MKRILLVLVALIALVACEKKEDPVATAISLDKTELTLKIGEKYSFKVIHTPSEAKAPEYMWIASKAFPSWSVDPVTIAEVDKNGVMTALKEGRTTISVSTTTLTNASGESLKSQCVVTIEPIKAEGIKLNKNKTTIKAGEAETLTYTITPETTTNKDVVWSSSDPKIVTVSNGVVKTIGAGTATVSVTVKNTSIKDVCEVTVDPAKVEGLKLKESEKTIMQGESFELSPVFTPEYATNKNIKWSSSDEKLALVDNLGNVKTVGYGACVIKAVSEDGGFEATCKVIVEPIPVQSIEFDSYQYKIEIGGEEQLSVTILPENAGNKEIRWSSSNDIIAPIDQNGLVKGNSTGWANITAKSVDGGFEASCRIWVAEMDQFVDLYFPSASVIVMNGYVTGSIYSGITNNSSKTITLTKFEIIDSNTWKVVAGTTDESKLGSLSHGQSTNLGGRLNNIYEPIFVWYFTYNGVEYRKEKQYGKDSPYSTTMKTKGNADNLIDLSTLE